VVGIYPKLQCKIVATFAFFLVYFCAVRSRKKFRLLLNRIDITVRYVVRVITRQPKLYLSPAPPIHPDGAVQAPQPGLGKKILPEGADI
jgi:hypothetical protein